MAYDNHASFTKIGLSVVLGTAAVIATLVYLAGFGDHSNELMVETYFNDSVAGLSVGSSVNYRGVKVGEVREISFVPARYPESCSSEDVQRVWVLMALDLRNFHVRNHDDAERTLRGAIDRGLRATVSTSGITGLSRIELGKPKVPDPLERLAWKSENPLIPPSPSLMNSLSDALRLAVDRFNKMDFVSVWSNISSVAESSAKVAEGANRLVESQRGGIGSIVRNVDDASQSVRDLTERLKDNPSLIFRSTDPAPLPETAQPFGFARALQN